MTAFDRFEWQNAWIDDPRVHDELISVLAVLFRYVNVHGTCYPSQDTIAHHLRRSTRTVQRRLTQIESIGYLARTGSNTIYKAKIPTRKATPMTPDTTPVTEAHDTGDTCTNNKATPMTPDTTPVTEAHDTGDARHDTSVALTVQEQSKNSPLEEVAQKTPVETSTDYQPPPQQILLELCQQAEINLAEVHINQLWNSTSKKLGEAQAWEYLRWKLADLHGTTYPIRKKFEYLTNDVNDWLKKCGHRNVGRNDYIQPVITEQTTPETSAPETTFDAESTQRAQAVWADTQKRLQSSVSQTPFSQWIAPITALGIQNNTLHLDAQTPFRAVFADDEYQHLILKSLAETETAHEISTLKFYPEEYKND